MSTDGGDPERLVECEDVAIPTDGDSLGTIAVVGFAADEPGDRSTSGLAVDTQLAYVSADKLYLATSAWSFGGCFDFCVADGIGAPRWLPGGGGSDDGVSHLYAFDLDGRATTYAASGEVDGTIRDRWAMDEAGGVLRVAVGPTGQTGNFNSVVTFRQDGNDLVEAGRVDKLGVERGRSSPMRWFDGLAIMVTFRQVDPLYAIDLTDPDEPKLMGQLKIPGFSAYLHPLGQHRLLGLGEGPDPGRAELGRAGRPVQRHRPDRPAPARRRLLRPQQLRARDPGPAPAHLAPRAAQGPHRHQRLQQGRPGRPGLGALARRRAAREPDGRGRARQRRQRGPAGAAARTAGSCWSPAGTPSFFEV